MAELFGYEYEAFLTELRILLNKEGKSKPSTYQRNIRPLVILLEEFLRERGYEVKDDRRELRLGILTYLTKVRVGTTYDLSAYQCSTITRFFLCGEGYSFTEDTEQFLGDITDRVAESIGIQPRKIDRKRVQSQAVDSHQMSYL